MTTKIIVCHRSADARVKRRIDRQKPIPPIMPKRAPGTKNSMYMRVNATSKMPIGTNMKSFFAFREALR